MGRLASTGQRLRLVISNLGRDIINFTYPYDQTTVDLASGGARRLRLLPASVGGTAPNGTNAATDCVFIVSGRMNREQRKLFHDWVESQPWGSGVWNDTRAWAGIFGDSYMDDITGAWMQRGLNPGAPAIDACCEDRYAFGGMNIKGYLYPVLDWTLRDMDTSKRPGYAIITGEYNNGGTLSENYHLGMVIKAIDRKFRVALISSTLNSNNLRSAPDGANEDMQLHAVSQGHADVYVDTWHTTAFDPVHFGSGAPDKLPILWMPSTLDPSQHPSPLGQELWLQQWRTALAYLLGANVENQATWLAPSSDLLELTIGGPSVTPGWSAITLWREARETTPLAFSSGDAAIAAVSDRGEINAVAAGQTYVKAVSPDGAVGLIVVRVVTTALA